MKFKKSSFFCQTSFILFVSFMLSFLNQPQLHAANPLVVRGPSTLSPASFAVRGIVPPCFIVQYDSAGRKIAVIQIDQSGNVVRVHTSGRYTIPSYADVYDRTGRIRYARNYYDQKGRLTKYTIFRPAVQSYINQMQVRFLYFALGGHSYPPLFRMEYTDRLGHNLRDAYFDRNYTIDHIDVNDVAREREIARHAVQYDGLGGRILGRMSFAATGNVDYYLIYEYNAQGQLTRRTHLDSGPGVVGYSTYQYDSTGNRIARFGFDYAGRQTSLALYKPSYDASGNFVGIAPLNTPIANLFLRPMQAATATFPSRVVCYDANDSPLRTILFDPNLPNAHVLFVVYHSIPSMALDPSTVRFYNRTNQLEATNSYDAQANLISFTLFGNAAVLSNLPLLQSYGVNAPSRAVHYDANDDPIKSIVYGANGQIEQLTVHQVTQANAVPVSVSIFDPSGALIQQYSSGGTRSTPPPSYQPNLNDILARQAVEAATRRQIDSVQGTTYITTGELAQPESHQDLWPR